MKPYTGVIVAVLGLLAWQWWNAPGADMDGFAHDLAGVWNGACDQVDDGEITDNESFLNAVNEGVKEAGRRNFSSDWDKRLEAVNKDGKFDAKGVSRVGREIAKEFGG